MKFWSTLYAKVQAALGAALALDGVFIIAAINGSTSWGVAITSSIAIDIPVLAAYLKSETSKGAAP